MMKPVFLCIALVAIVSLRLPAQEFAAEGSTAPSESDYVDDQVPGGKVVGSVIAAALSTGLPLGMPPGPTDQRMLSVPPADTAVYLTWANVAAANGKSTNRTEQLIANEEMQYLFKQVEQSYQGLLASAAGSDPMAQVLASMADQLGRTLLTHETAGYMRFSADGPVGGIVCDLGDEAETVRNIAAGAAKTAGDNLSETTENGLTVYTVQGVPGPPIQFTVGNQYLVVGVGPQELGSIVSRLTAREVTPWLTKARQRVAIEKVANLAYVNIDRFDKALANEVKMPKEIASLADQLGSEMACASGLGSDAVVVRSWFDVSEELGRQLKAISGTATESDLTNVAHDGVASAILKMNPTPLVDSIFRVLNDVEPDSASDFEREFEQTLGFNFRKDLIASLGDTISVYESPREGGRLLTGWTATIAIQDEQKLAAVIAKLQQMLFDDNGPMQIKSRPYAGRTVSYLSFQRDAPLIVPSWCISDGQLIVSAFPQGVFGWLSRPSTPGSKSTITNLKQQDASVFFRMNEKTVAQHVYPLVVMLQSYTTAELDDELRDVITLDAAALPSLPSITDHLNEATVSIGFSDGIEVIRHQTLPPSGLGLATAVGVATGGLDEVADGLMRSDEPAVVELRYGDRDGRDAFDDREAYDRKDQIEIEAR